MVREPVRTITTATYEAVDTDQEFTLFELEDVLHRLKDTAPGNQTPLPQTHQPVIDRVETAHYIENSQDYIDPHERQNECIVLSHYFCRFRKSWNDWC